MMKKKDESRPISIDIEAIQHTKPGQKVVNTLLFSNGILYRTKRGHLAVQIKPDRFAQLQGQLKIELADGLDGTRNIIFLPE